MSESVWNKIMHPETIQQREARKSMAAIAAVGASFMADLDEPGVREIRTKALTHLHALGIPSVAVQRLTGISAKLISEYARRNGIPFISARQFAREARR